MAARRQRAVPYPQFEVIAQQAGSENEMTTRASTLSPLSIARAAGGLYLTIIVLGLVGEFVVRGSLIARGDPDGTAANLVAGEGLLRFGFLADSIVFMSDAAVAALLYVLLRPINRTVALAAAAFRLVQTAVLALNLLNQHSALLLVTDTPYAGLGLKERNALAYLMLDQHAHGYDLGLLFFGVHCALVGYLIVKSTFLPSAIGVLLSAAAIVYVVGSYVHFLAPTLVEPVMPIYIVALVAEVALCGWLLVKGVDVRRWEATRAVAALT